MSITVGIVVPVYNAENSLNRCVNSILNQTYKNFELILVNDGSKDNSGRICDEYEKQDKRIKTIHQKNNGVSAARNNGMRISNGEYFIFVDSDDWIEPNTLEILIENNKIDDYDLIMYGYIMEFNYSEYSTITISPEYKIYNNAKDYVNEFEYYASNKLFTYSTNKLYKSNVIKENNILFKEDVSYGEDLYFNLDILKYCKSIKVIDDVLYHYMHESQNTLSKISRDEPNTTNKLYENKVNFLKSMNCYQKNEVYINSNYIENIIDYISTDLYNGNNRVKKLRLLYKDKKIRFAINISSSDLLYYKIISRLIKYRLCFSTIAFIKLYKVYEKIKG